MNTPVTAAATFCATLVDEWIACGVRHAVIAPGSRSTPLALALVDRAELSIHVVHDERSASFLALGIGRATGAPAVLLCTSGTAAAEFHAAVAEADLDEVPMIVATADRPPELRGVMAPQAIDQQQLYGGMVRWFVDPGTPDSAMTSAWRTIARRSVWTAAGSRPGPVHLNLPFREPLVGRPDPLPPRLDAAMYATSIRTLDDTSLGELAATLNDRRGIIVAGGGRYDGSAVLDLAEALGWPVLAEARSPARRAHPNVVGAYDAILRHPRFADDHRPTVVLRVGFLPASKVLSQWITGSGAVVVQLHDTDAWIDPDHIVARRVVADIGATCRALIPRLAQAPATPWLGRWRHTDDRTQGVLADVLAGHLSEPAVARAVVGSTPAGGALVVSSSMPIRDVEWFSQPRDAIAVYANRGANGIDGVVSTAVGVAVTDPARPVVLLIGDVAFLHDTNGLLALTTRAANLTIVVVDNRGGGIFSFLPQAAALGHDRFEQLFGTPHEVDLAMLAAAHGLATSTATTAAELNALVVEATATPGASVIVVRTERAANVETHAAVNAAVVAALSR